MGGGLLLFDYPGNHCADGVKGADSFVDTSPQVKEGAAGIIPLIDFRFNFIGRFNSLLGEPSDFTGDNSKTPPSIARAACFSLMTAMISSSLDRLRFMGHPPSAIPKRKTPA